MLDKKYCLRMNRLFSEAQKADSIKEMHDSGRILSPLAPGAMLFIQTDAWESAKR